MSFSRILANALARRIAYVIVAALLAWIGLGKAHAQSYADCGNMSFTGANCLDEGSAYTNAMARSTAQVAALNSAPNSLGDYVLCAPVKTTHIFAGGIFWNRWRVAYGRAGGCSNGSTSRDWPETNDCAAKPSYSGSINATKSPSLENCKGGCMYKGSGTGIDDQWVSDGSQDETPGLWVHTTFGPTGATCSVPPVEEKPECPTGQHRNDKGVCVEQGDCPVGQSMIGGVCTPDGKCPVGQIKAPDGSCTEESCPAGRAKGKDGTCKVDADNDGVPDDEEEGNEDGDKFSGGDACDSPPACSGDAILCGSARIQWRIDCNTRKDRNIVGGSCDAMPICVGKNCDAMEYSQLLMQWRTSCKTSEGGEGETGIKDHMTALKQAEVNALRALGTDDGHGGVSEGDIFHTFSNDDFDPNMFGGSPGGTCSFGTSLELLGHPITLPPSFWTAAQFIGLLMVACAYLWIAFQLGS